MALSELLLPPAVSAILSGVISWKVAEWTTNRRLELQNEQRVNEWYQRAIMLAERTEDEWWDVMTSGEKNWDVQPVDTFRTRREELYQHAAEGQALGVEDEIHTSLKQAAGSLGAAIGSLEAGKDLAKIEKKHLLPVLDTVRSLSKKRLERG